MKRMPQDAVERRLMEEARSLRERDGFSPDLHAHMMESLRRRGLGDAADPPSRHPWFWRAAVPLGVAAAVALAMWLIVRPSDVSHPPQDAVAGGKVPELPAQLVPSIDAQVAAPTVRTLEEGKYAYLDRDARKLMLFVADQLPDFPQQK